MDFDAHRGRHRLFLIFAVSGGDDLLVRQDRLLEGSRDGFDEREIIRGDLLEDGTGSFSGRSVSPEEASAARERFGVEPGRFLALLVGKDATAKHRFDEPVGPDKLYDLIDAMPMRQREMREREEDPSQTGERPQGYGRSHAS